MIENPNFEVTDDSLPGWDLVGASKEDAIVSGDAHSGHHFLKLTPTGGRSACVSQPAQVSPSRKYGLVWWMRMEGGDPWHWTYLTRFTGVEIEFLSEAGERISSEPRRIRCLRTPGWRRSWLVFETPEDASKVRVAFVLDSPTEISMEMHIDEVELEPIPEEIPAAKGRLRLNALVEGESETTYARFSVRDTDGIEYWPDFSFPFKDGRFYHVNDLSLNYLDLPGGRYSVKASKGPEYLAAERDVEISPGQELEVSLELKRGLRTEDWYGGDHHVHLFFHKGSMHPQMTIQDVMKIAKGEGLNFVSFCGEWSELEDNLGNHQIAKERDFMGQVGLESVNDFYGHLCTMGWKEIPEQSIPMRCVPWPMNTDTIESLESQGGAWVNAHPFDRILPGKVVENMADPERLCNARELPIILGLGHRTNIDILCHSTPGGAELKTAEYYRLLNMGFKEGVTASTDFYVDQGRGTPGHNRTYVRADSFDFRHISEGYRRGRTYATNGPLVEFEVDGHQIGDEFNIPAPGKLTVKVKAFSRMGLDQADVILNGKVVHVLSAEGNWIEGECAVDVDKSSWVALHVKGPVDDDIEPWDLSPDQRNLQDQFCHTSPVFVRVGDDPIRAKREDVEFLLDWLDAAVSAFHAIDRMWDGYPDEHYLASSYSDEDRKRIAAAFEKRVARAKRNIARLLEG